MAKPVFFLKAETFSRYGQDASFELPAAADLERSFDLYLKKLERDLEDLGMNPNFSDGVESFYRDSNTLALLALAIGLSSEDSPRKKAMPEVLSATIAASGVKNLEEARASVAAIQKALDSEGDLSALKWEKVARLEPIMKKALPSITTEIKRLSRSEKTLTRSNNLEKVIGDAATLVVISVGCRPNVDETLAPTEKELWESYCDRLYSTARDLNQKASAFREGNGSFDEFSAAFKALDATCNTTCHEKFGGTAQ